MVVADLLTTVAATDVGCTDPPWIRTGSDECDFDDEIEEGARLQPRQRRHLGTRLHLEHPTESARHSMS